MWSTVSRHQRGYGSDWDKRRKRILARDFGICQPCLKLGKTHIGNQVDHIKSRAECKCIGWSHERMESDDNLQTICDDAHKAKTIEEQGKTFVKKQIIGIDGYPI